MSTPITILIADDEPRCRDLLSGLLRRENYRLIMAENGRQALELAREHRPDAALLDVMMPELDGFEVCRHLREDPWLVHMPVLLLTALDDRASRLRGLDAGADDFLSKPFDSTELRTRLRVISRLSRFRLLSEERARFEQTLAGAPDGVVVTDEEGRMLFSNAAFHRLVERDGGSDGFFCLVPPATETKLRQGLRGTEPGPVRFGPIESELRTGRPRETTVEITAARMAWDGRAAWQFNVRDITEKKELEEQLLRSQRLELIGHLAGGVVHDVNNLLAAINAQAMLLELTDFPDPEHRLRAIQQSAMRGAGMLRQLLLFARGGEGESTDLFVGEVVGEVAALVRETLGGGVALSCEIAPGLPALRGDATQIHQVIMNLCVNARDAMVAGGNIRIFSERRALDEQAAESLGAREARPGDFIVIGVQDEGAGMSAEVRKRIFEPFFTTKERGKGTGLGLATVLRIVKRHGGFLAVQSELGRGSCFECYLPVAAAAAVPGGADPAPVAGAHGVAA